MSARLAITPHFTVASLCCVMPAALVAAQTEAKQVYNLPRGDAAVTLPLFADACGRPVVFLMDKVRGEQTNAVAGDFSPHEAIERMLAGTSLVAHQDNATGGFTVTRRPAPAPREEVERKTQHQPQPPSVAMTPAKPSGLFRTLLAFLLPVLTYGQESSSDASKKKEGETVVLSPFTVSVAKDNGYRATNSISGTRLDTSIKNLPLSLEVITSDFIRDTGALNLREALRYSPGIVLQSQYDSPLSAALTNVDTPDTAAGNNPEGATRDSGQSTIKIRGYITSSTLRDGLLRQSATDSINLERVEVLRGPSALLYGIGNFGGIVNYLPKVPTVKPSYHAGVTVGSNGLYRTEMDVSPGTIYSHPGLVDVGVRLTGAWQENGDFTDDYKHKHWFLAPVVQLKLWENTLLKFETEFGSSKDIGTGFQSVRSRVISNNYPFSTTARLFDFYTPPGTDKRTFRWSGGDTYLKNDLSNSVIDLQQKFTDQLWLHATGGYTKKKEDSRNIWYGNLSTLNPLDANGNPTDQGVTATMPVYYKTPTNAAQTQYLANLATAASQGGNAWVAVWNARPANFWLGDIYGTTVTPTYRKGSTANSGELQGPQPYTVLNYQWAQYHLDEDRWQGRIDLNYKLDFYGHHNFLIGMQYDFDHQEQTNHGQLTDQSTGSANKNSNPVIWNYANPGIAKTLKFGVQGDGVTPSVAMQPLTWTLNKTWTLGYFAIYQGQFFKDRLTIVGGARRDRIDFEGQSRSLWNGGPLTFSDRAHSGAAVVEKNAPTKISPQAGVSVALTHNISVFGVYSTGLLPNPIGSLDGLGNSFGPVTAKNRELGLKFDMLNGKISGSVSYFKIERANVARNIWWSPGPGVPRDHAYDPSKPVMMGFYDWGQLSPYVAWYASRTDLSTTAPWAKIYPQMASILSKVPVDPVRKYGGFALPLGALDVNSGPSSQAVDASGHPLGMTLAQLWTQTVGAANMPAMPTNAPGTDSRIAMNTNAANPWQAAWVATNGLMVSDKTKNEISAQQLMDVMWNMNDTTTRAHLSDPNAQVIQWNHGIIPWLWAGNGGSFPIYPGYWSDPNAGDDGTHLGIMNSQIGVLGSKVAFTDQSEGMELQVNMQATDNLQIVAGWSRVMTKNTTATLPYVKIDDPTGNQAYGGWDAMGGSFGTFYYTKAEAFKDPNDTSSFRVAPFDYGLALDDTPKDTVTLWSKYSFHGGSMKGFGIGLGGVWESQRLYDASVAVDGSVSGTIDPKTGRTIADQIYTKARTTVNMVLDYETKFFKDRYPVRFALNIDNLLADKKQYGYIYAPGLSWRFSTSVGF